MKLPLPEPEHPLPAVQVTVIAPSGAGVSTIVMLLTWTLALLVMLPPTLNCIVSGFPLVTVDPLQLLVNCKHPLPAGAQPFELLTNQEAPFAGPVRVLPSGAVAEAWARLSKVDELKLVWKCPL